MAGHNLHGALQPRVLRERLPHAFAGTLRPILRPARSLWLHLAGAWHHQTRFFLAREVGFTHSAVTLGSIFSYIINGPIAAGFLLMDGTRGGVHIYGL